MGRDPTRAMWERKDDDEGDADMDVELVMLDGARSDGPSSDPQPENAVQASSPSTIRPSWRASCQMPSRGRLALANRYIDLLFITATMAIMETSDKVMLAGAAISFALIACQYCLARTARARRHVFVRTPCAHSVQLLGALAVRLLRKRAPTHANWALVRSQLGPRRQVLPLEGHGAAAGHRACSICVQASANVGRRAV